MSMKLGDNDNAMRYGRLQVLLPPNHKFRAYSIHGYGLPEVSTEIWSFWGYGKVSLVYVHEIW